MTAAINPNTGKPWNAGRFYTAISILQHRVRHVSAMRNSFLKIPAELFSVEERGRMLKILSDEEELLVEAIMVLTENEKVEA